MKTVFVLRMFVLFLLGFFFVQGTSFAADSGKSFGMAGAFVALADDFSAQFYNPAGITQIKKPTAGLSLRNSSLKLSSSSTTESYSCSYFNPLETQGLIWPLGNVALALGSETTLDNYFEFSQTTGIYTDTIKYDDKLYIPSIAIGSEIIPDLSLGLNLSYILRKGTLYVSSQSSSPSITDNLPIDGSSLGAVGGMLYKPFPQLSLGAAIKYLGDVNVSSNFRVTNGTIETTGTLSFNEKYPLTNSIGLAYKPVENLTLAFQTDFVGSQDYKIKYITTTTSGSSSTEGQVKTNSVVGLHAGVEYLIPAGAGVIPLRAGYFSQPSNTDELGSSGGLQPFFDTSTVAVGSGYNTDNFGIDVGAQFINMSKKLSSIDYTLTDTKILASGFLKF